MPPIPHTTSFFSGKSATIMLTMGIRSDSGGDIAARGAARRGAGRASGRGRRKRGRSGQRSDGDKNASGDGSGDGGGGARRRKKKAKAPPAPKRAVPTLDGQLPAVDSTAVVQPRRARGRG
jgi:hypothetical protein